MKFSTTLPIATCLTIVTILGSIESDTRRSDVTAIEQDATYHSTTLFTADESKTFVQCFAAPENPQDRRFNTSQLTVGTFNAEFLFLRGLGQLKCPGSGCDWKNRKMAEEHLIAVADVIRDMNVDILQLTEVEDCHVLQSLVDTLGDDSYKPYVIRGTDNFTGQNVGLITRVDPIEDLTRTQARVSYPIASSSCGWTRADARAEARQAREQAKYTTSNKRRRIGPMAKSKGVSKHFMTRFNVAGLDAPVTLVAAHFLANPQSKARCIAREAQATVIADLANAAAAKGDHVIILGDLNDFDGNVLDIKKSQPISRVLGLLSEVGDGLQNVAQYVPTSERYTCWWDRYNKCDFKVPQEVSSLDHILLSNGLADQISQVKFGHDLFSQGCASLVSDHFPITVTMDTLY